MVAGFRTCEADGGPLDGSIYSFSPSTHTSRRFKRKIGDSDENTLRPERAVFFIPPHRKDEVRNRIVGKGYSPVLFWIKPDQSQYRPDRDGHNGLAINNDGSLAASPEPGALPVLRFCRKDTNTYDDKSYLLSSEPQIGFTPLELTYTSSGNGKFDIVHHIGHPVAELFGDAQDLSKKIELLNLPVTVDKTTGHLQEIPVIRRSNPPINLAEPIQIIRRSAQAPIPTIQRSTPPPAPNEPGRIIRRTTPHPQPSGRN